MPDITMCHGEGCPLKEKCKRHTIKPDEYWQAYFTETPYENDECDYYWADPKFKDNESLNDQKTS
jgi:hypothetical protein